ncbi:hypothetical protein TGRUB_428930 [Toxoplasma gondii RUB]|uniref:Uncharacterized protein n=1 Tax=Toxoplasma gondii RUB TaxID=935652 RepID=A0A086M9P9_TOXGO|nr:hypothetical protein TGRUB_428930 [Toxoplasma gondii RUB]
MLAALNVEFGGRSKTAGGIFPSALSLLLRSSSPSSVASCRFLCRGSGFSEEVSHLYALFYRSSAVRLSRGQTYKKRGRKSASCVSRGEEVGKRAERRSFSASCFLFPRERPATLRVPPLSCNFL